jgi:glycosyltransferase involved in cell wall biosynthesis
MASCEKPADRDATSCDVTIVAQEVGGIGGMERSLAELVAGLRAFGHPVTVIARTCELPPGVEVNLHRVRGPSRPALLGYPWFMLAGSLAVRRHRQGIVQATGALVVNHPDVIAVHCLQILGPSEASRRTLLFRVHALLVGAVKRRAERWLFPANRSSVFVCVSDGLAVDVGRNYPELADRTRTVPLGVRAVEPGSRVEDGRQMRVRLRIPCENLVAALVGTGWKRKGLEPAIYALAASPGWNLVVAGGDDPRPYEAVARSLGVDDRVHWLGVTRDVALVYALADAFLLPTSYETFSLATYEAAASGLPILVTPVSGVADLLHDGDNGFAIDRDPRTIAHRLNLLGGDASLRSRLGAAARRSAAAFTWEQMSAAYHELFEDLAAGAEDR